METLAQRQRRTARILELLHQTYPHAECALTHHNPYELLVATILSAQCTDKRVNMVTPAVFKRYPDARALARAVPAELEQMIASTGFFRNKTKNLLGMAQAVVERHDGAIPDSMEQLHQLPGVGRKTANVVLGTAFGKNEGVVVDTHVHRITRLLGLTAADDPIKIELDLMKVLPQDEWSNFSHMLIHHGRNICVARKPQCEVCPLYDYCPGHRPLHDEAPRAAARKPPAVRKTAARKTAAPARKSSSASRKPAAPATKPAAPARKAGKAAKRG
jgi:endonuclease-3